MADNTPQSAGPRAEPRPLVGLALSPGAARISRTDPDLVDYLEVPFELLESSPAVLDKIEVPAILHCASLSIGGTVLPKPGILDRIRHWLAHTDSPWLGEHLAFLLADRPPGATAVDGQRLHADTYAEPYNLGFTVAPPMNPDSVDSICRRLSSYQAEFSVPIIVENSPVYFDIPGSTLRYPDFLNQVLARSNVGLLLDLTHLVIAAHNQGFSPEEAIDELPLHRVTEVHVSGIELCEGLFWDHHASGIPERVLRLLSRVAQVGSVRAVTLEYNWISNFTDDQVREQSAAIRKIVQ